MTCIQCGAEFISKRKTAKFCSDVCRVKYSRQSKVSVTDSVTDNSKVSVTKVSVTDALTNTCQYCGLVFSQHPEYAVANNHIRETCYDCVANNSNIPRRKYPAHTKDCPIQGV